MDSYKENIFEPLEYYRDFAKNAHKTNSEEYFEDLVAKSGIDVEQNRSTVRAYKEKVKRIEHFQKERSREKRKRVFSIIFSILFVIIAIIIPNVLSMGEVFKALFPLLAIIVSVVVIILVFKKTGEILSQLNDKLNALNAEAAKLRSEAEIQMLPLNRLFSDNDSYVLIEKTLPQIKFNRQFVLENLQDLRNNYGFNNTIGPKSSVFDVLSGSLYKNPFLFERFVTETMVQHTYTGTLVITWTTYTRDSKGNRVARRHSQTLVARLVRPKPNYEVQTLLNYGSQAAPDLTFSRENKHYEDLSEKAVQRTIRKGKKKLKKKSENALKEGGTFTEMANADFDVLFDATNRDNEQQFRVLFTPLAQKEMIDLIRSEEGYGDDFDFFKIKKLNVIRSEHAQSMVLHPSASYYYSFDVDDARNKFITFNAEYFKAIYFDFAPLIAIPAYQQEPATSFEEISHADIGYTEYNYETIANKMGASCFAHEETSTDSILKTQLIKRTREYDTVSVTAYSYKAIPRTDFVPVLGGDGKMHSVPVHWLEYIPLQKTSLMNIRNIGLTETDYNTRCESVGRLFAPNNAACFRGMFGYTETDEGNVTKFLNSIINNN